MLNHLNVSEFGVTDLFQDLHQSNKSNLVENLILKWRLWSTNQTLHDRTKMLRLDIGHYQHGDQIPQFKESAPCHEMNIQLLEDQWIIFANGNSVRAYPDHQSTMYRLPKENNNFENIPEFDPIMVPFKANHTDYSFETFMYYVIAGNDYHVPNIMSQEDEQIFERYMLTYVLKFAFNPEHRVTLTDEDCKSFLKRCDEGLDDAGFLSLSNIIINNKFRLDILLPNVIGKIMYQLNKSSAKDSKNIQLAQQILLLWVPDQLATSVMLQNYQPLLAYEKIEMHPSLESIYKQTGFNDPHSGGHIATGLNAINKHYGNDITSANFKDMPDNFVRHMPRQIPYIFTPNVPLPKSIKDAEVAIFLDTKENKYYSLKLPEFQELTQETGKFRKPMVELKHATLKNQVKKIKAAQEKLNTLLADFGKNKSEMGELLLVTSKQEATHYAMLDALVDKTTVATWHYTTDKILSNLKKKWEPLEFEKDEDSDGYKFTMLKKDKGIKNASASDSTHITHNKTVDGVQTTTSVSKSESNGEATTNTHHANSHKTAQGTTAYTTHNRTTETETDANHNKKNQISSMADDQTKGYGSDGAHSLYSFHQKGTDEHGKFKEDLFSNLDWDTEKLPSAKKDYLDKVCHIKDAHVRLLRYSGQSAVDATYNSAEGVLAIAGTESRRLDLIDASITFSAYLPTDRKGREFILKLSSHELSLGVFRSSLELKLTGTAGASVLISGHVDIQSVPIPEQVRNKWKKHHGEALPADAKKHGVLGFQGSKAGVKMGAFAGAQAGAELTGKIEWATPEHFDGIAYILPVANPLQASTRLERPKFNKGQSKFESLIECTPTGAVDAGLGGSIEFNLGYDQNKGQLYSSVSATAVMGIGLTGKIESLIGAETIKNVAVFIYHQLKDSNFVKSVGYWISEIAYDIYSGLVAMAAWAGKTLKEFVDLKKRLEDQIEGWFAKIEDDYHRFLNAIESAILSSINYEAKIYAEKIEALANNLLSVPYYSMVKFSTPKTKGLWLYQLSHYSEVYASAPSQKPYQAMLWILDHIQSVEDFKQVMKNVVNYNKPETTVEHGMRHLLEKLNKIKPLNIIVSKLDQMVFLELSRGLSSVIKTLPNVLRLEALRSQAVSRIGLVEQERFHHKEFLKCLKNEYSDPLAGAYSMGGSSNPITICEVETGYNYGEEE